MATGFFQRGRCFAAVLLGPPAPKISALRFFIRLFDARPYCFSLSAPQPPALVSSTPRSQLAHIPPFPVDLFAPTRTMVPARCPFLGSLSNSPANRLPPAFLARFPIAWSGPPLCSRPVLLSEHLMVFRYSSISRNEWAAAAVP